jgi:Heparinase II/III-like protein/Heparinase II/III N-terminus
VSTTVRRPTRPRSVYCAVEHEHRDLQLAAAVAAGRFTHAGVTLDLGSEPDWLAADLPPDDEWRIDWWKFGYGLDLAHAFATTGDRVYVDAWERLVAGFLDQVPLGADASEVAARRIQHWLYAWNAFADASGFTGFEDAFVDRLLGGLGAQAAYVRENLAPERNHRTLELYALFLVALALPELDGDGGLLGFACRELHRNLLTDFHADGVHLEASTHYHFVALRSLVGARENARRFGLRLPDGYDALLERACDFALHSLRPDGAIPALSDSDTGRYGELLELAGDLLERDDLRWAGSDGLRGAPPEQTGASFASGGYFFQRSGWGRDARYLVLDCGPLGDGGHGHYDLLSVEIAADGRPLVVDPGRYTYAEGEPNLRRWFKGTAAHNTVCVDGVDQTPYRRGKPRGPVAEGRLLGRFESAGLDVLVGQAVSPAYDAIHTRRVVFVRREYWIVEDRLEGRELHRFALRWHLSGDADGRVGLVGPDTLLAPGIALVVAPPHAWQLESGWVAPEYGVRLPAPVVVATAGGDASTTFTTLVAPSSPCRPIPSLRVEVDGDTTTVEVTGETVDRIAWSRAPGSTAWLRP